MRTAVSARVSTDRPERDQTIDSQLAARRAWVARHGHELAGEHVYRDKGWSGARLDRPARDAVHEGELDVVAVRPPDCRARQYAYQALLLEQFRRAGCGLVFVRRPSSENPHGQLLRQVQGAVAEYERAVLSARFRRGKLRQARAGQSLGSHAPDGYRSVPRRDGVAGQLVVDEAEAEFVRLLYGWLIDEQLTIRQILQRLNFGPWFPRSGRHPWPPPAVPHILSDPVYAGPADANRDDFVAPKKPRPGRRLKLQEQWLVIPVPALIDQATPDRAQEQLARNAALSFRHNTQDNYLLRCLLTCSAGGPAVFGRTSKATATQRERRCYLCHGKDGLLSARKTPCPRRIVPAGALLAAAVWEHVAGLLREPAQLAPQFAPAQAAAQTGTAQEQEAERQARARLDRLNRADGRLLDACQAGAITLSELTERRAQTAQQCRAAEQEAEQRRRLREQLLPVAAVLASVEAFAARVGSRLEQATLADQQAILQLLVERVIVGEHVPKSVEGVSGGSCSSDVTCG